MNFFKRVTTSLVPSFIFGMLPWMFRETYNLPKHKQKVIFVAVFLLAYGVQLKNPYYELDEHNRKMARKYVELLHE